MQKQDLIFAAIKFTAFEGLRDGASGERIQ
jgi:hypothetical protein